MFEGDEIVRHVSGRWTGKLAIVEVFDRHGKSHDAVILQDWKGPHFTDKRVPPSELPSGPPILVHKEWFQIVSPSDVPLGEEVVVTGRLVVFHAHRAQDSEGVSRKLVGERTIPELLIDLSSPPRRLNAKGMQLRK